MKNQTLQFWITILKNIFKILKKSFVRWEHQFFKILQIPGEKTKPLETTETGKAICVGNSAAPGKKLDTKFRTRLARNGKSQFSTFLNKHANFKLCRLFYQHGQRNKRPARPSVLERGASRGKLVDVFERQQVDTKIKITPHPIYEINAQQLQTNNFQQI